MRKVLTLLAVAIAALAIPAFASIPLVSSSSGDTLFEFEALVGVSGAFLGGSLPLRGIPGGGLPWVLDEGEARLDEDGRFRVEVEGLVIDPAISHPAAGINPAPFFFATLSCLDVSTGGIVNLHTATVAVGTDGDAEIEEDLTLPSSCVAPVVLVRGSFTGMSAGPWFAASGFG